MIHKARSLLLFLILLILISPLAQSNDRIRISRIDIESYVLNEDIVIQGQIIAVEAKLMDKSKVLGGSIKDRGEWIVTELIIQIDRVITGEYEGATINAILIGGEYQGRTALTAGYSRKNPKVGENVIIFLSYNMFGYGNYILAIDEAFFKIVGDDLVPYVEQAYLDVDNPLEIIEKRAKARTFEEMYKTADLICVGNVKDVRDVYSFMRTGKLMGKFIVEIEETLKGEADNPEITIDASNFTPGFISKQIGNRVLLFLKKWGSNFKTIEGRNGYYTLKEGKLFKGNIAPILTTLEGLKESVEKWKVNDK